MLHQPSKNQDDELKISDDMETSAGDSPPKREPGSGRASRAAAQREVAKPKAPERPRVTRTASKKPDKNPYRTRSAAQIRAEREARQKRSITSLTDDPRPTPRRINVLDNAKVAYLLNNPTRLVTEDDLRRDYTYVIKDLRSMGLLSAALVAVLVALAYLLP